MSVKALVLCAGFGTRLGTLTAELPKALLPLAGEPLLAHTLRYLARHGVRQVAVNLHYRGDMIRQTIGNGARYAVDLHYQDEPQLLGTAGAVVNLADYFADSGDVLVLYGDILTDEDLQRMLVFHRRQRASATLLVHQRQRSNSMVELAADGRITGFLERPHEARRDKLATPWVNSGVQILGSGLIERMKHARPTDLPKDVYVPLHAEERFFGYPLTGYRCAIDSPERFAQAERALADGRLSGF